MKSCDVQGKGKLVLKNSQLKLFSLFRCLVKVFESRKDNVSLNGREGKLLEFYA